MNTLNRNERNYHSKEKEKKYTLPEVDEDDEGRALVLRQQLRRFNNNGISVMMSK